MTFLINEKTLVDKSEEFDNVSFSLFDWVLGL